MSFLHWSRGSPWLLRRWGSRRTERNRRSVCDGGFVDVCLPWVRSKLPLLISSVTRRQRPCRALWKEAQKTIEVVAIGSLAEKARPDLREFICARSRRLANVTKTQSMARVEGLCWASRYALDTGMAP